MIDRIIPSEIDRFLDEIRSGPMFAAAARMDPTLSKHLESVELALNEIDRRADEDPAMVEAFDNVVAVIADNGRSLRQRLLDLNEVLIPLRDKLFGVRH